MSLTHVDERGRPHGGCRRQGRERRMARAEAEIVFPLEIDRQLRAQGFHVAKGPVLATAIIAGVMGAKRTAELILLPSAVAGRLRSTRSNRRSRAVGGCCAASSFNARTGAEMEA